MSQYHYTQEKQWGNMLKAWEAQVNTHHEMCPNRKGWDMSCQCKFINEIIKYVEEFIG